MTDSEKRDLFEKVRANLKNELDISDDIFALLIGYSGRHSVYNIMRGNSRVSDSVALLCYLYDTHPGLAAEVRKRLAGGP